jgi:signal transduction histidine kinase
MHGLTSAGLNSACLAHDMGNLLQVIASALNLIDRELAQTEPEGIKSLCQNARIALDRIVTLRRQILEIARVQPTLVRPVDPVAVIASLQGLIELILGPGMGLDIVCAARVPSVVCDPQELGDVILNLVVNASDAMPVGGRLTVSLEHDGEAWDDPGILITASPRLILKISDTGCGMPADVLDKVFDPFFSTNPQPEAPAWACQWSEGLCIARGSRRD